MFIKASDLRNGDKIEHMNDVWILSDVMHRTPGNLRAFIQARLTSLTTGRSRDERFSSTDRIKQADLEAKKMQYLYREDDLMTFMDSDSYEQIQIAAANLGEAPSYMTENMDVMVQFRDGSPMSVELPPNVVLKITKTEPGVKGDTVNNVLKPAEVETGRTVQVPIFINEGETIKVDTRTGEYLGRVNE